MPPQQKGAGGLLVDQDLGIDLASPRLPLVRTAMLAIEFNRPRGVNTVPILDVGYSLQKFLQV